MGGGRGGREFLLLLNCYVFVRDGGWGGGGLGVSAFTLIFMFLYEMGGGGVSAFTKKLCFCMRWRGKGSALSIGVLRDLEQEWIYMRGGGGGWGVY